MSLRAAPGLLLALALAAGCGREAASLKGSRGRSLILITCDTLRADRLGIYGYARPTSPALDAFARECTVYENAWSAAPMTLPALASLMTGRLPDELGMSSNKRLLSPQATTLAELASAAGLHTAAVVSNWVLRKHPEHPDAGLSQGFADYDDRMEESEANRSGVYERRAAGTTDAAIAWLDQRSEGRFFLWVHYQDPHGPYTPPADCVATLDRPLTDEPELTVGKTQVGLHEIPAYQVLGAARAPEYYRIRYDAEIRSFDRELGRLLAHLRETGVLEDAFVVFTADHGESLGEHGYWFSHGQSVYRELVNVPLLLRFPGASPRPDGVLLRRSEPVGHVDLLPTLLDALGLAEVPGHGQTLLGPAPLRPFPPTRFFAHTLREPASSVRWEGATDGVFHYVAGPDGHRLFDLARDPGELHDLAASERLRLHDFETTLARELARFPAIDSIPANESSADLERLRGLGYAGGESEPADH